MVKVPNTPIEATAPRSLFSQRLALAALVCLAVLLIPGAQGLVVARGLFAAA